MGYGHQPEQLKEKLAQCFAVVATNYRLYEIGKAANPRTVLIPNGINLDHWKRLPLKEGKFTVGFCGNIATAQYRKYKGYDVTEAAAKKTNSELKTALYGEKQIPHSRMYADFYGQISVLVHPTLGEGCSNTILEALACGIPVITTREAGLHGEVMEDGENILFCKRDADDIARQIMRLKRSRKLREKLSVNGRAFAEEHHDIRKVAQRYDLLFQDCQREVDRIKANTKVEEAGMNRQVKVKAKRQIWEGGLRPAGTIFYVSEHRAKQLSGVVEVIESMTPVAPPKQFDAPPVDKMIYDAPVKKAPARKKVTRKKKTKR